MPTKVFHLLHSTVNLASFMSCLVVSSIVSCCVVSSSVSCCYVSSIVSSVVSAAGQVATCLTSPLGGAKNCLHCAGNFTVYNFYCGAYTTHC